MTCQGFRFYNGIYSKRLGWEFLLSCNYPIGDLQNKPYFTSSLKVKLALSNAILVQNLDAIIVVSFSESLESVIQMNELLFHFMEVPIVRYQTNNFIRFCGNGGCIT